MEHDEGDGKEELTRLNRLALAGTTVRLAGAGRLLGGTFLKGRWLAREEFEDSTLPGGRTRGPGAVITT